MKKFQDFALQNATNIIGRGKPAWAGKPDKSTWESYTVIDEDGEEELEYIAPWEDYEGGRKQYMTDMAEQQP